MPNYDWREFQSRPWSLRFPDSARGAEEWRSDRGVASTLGSLFQQRLARVTKPPKPCMFVSHRRADIQQALRVAYLACQEGFDYWLDVLDPSLNQLPVLGVGGLPQQQRALAIAGIIEMALLNSTHVLAVITSHTKGSFWVPYEYGRVKDPVPASLQAACWIDSSVQSKTLPEYLYLGAVTKSESDLRSWLVSELTRYGAQKSPCSWPTAVPGSI